MSSGFIGTEEDQRQGGRVVTVRGRDEDQVAGQVLYGSRPKVRWKDRYFKGKGQKYGGRTGTIRGKAEDSMVV